MDYRLLLIPILSGLIGWGTNWLAVKMLFRPRRAIKLGPIAFQGLIPRRQNDLARHIGRTVEEHLISHEDLRAALNDPAMHEQVVQVIHEKIAYFIDHRLITLNPMIGMFLKGELREKLEAMLIAEIEPMIPELSERLLNEAESRINFSQLVEEKISAFDLDKLESIIQTIASKELRAIEILGGVLGLIIGFAQLVLIQWIIPMG